MSILFAVAFFFAALAVQRSLCKMMREVIVHFPPQQAHARLPGTPLRTRPQRS